MQELRMPDELVEWLDKNSPEIARIGAANIKVHLVEELPFWFTSSKVDAQVWDGRVYLKKDWASKYIDAPYLVPMADRFLHLYFHELYHVVSQYRKNWFGWLLRYAFFGWKKEERGADEFRDKLILLWESRRI